MAAVTADQVVVEITAKTDQYVSGLKSATSAATDFKSLAEKSANDVEATIANSSSGSKAALSDLAGGFLDAAAAAGAPSLAVEALSGALTGGLTVAIGVAIPLLVGLAEQFLSTGDDADDAADRIKGVTDALARLHGEAQRPFQNPVLVGQIQVESLNQQIAQLERQRDENRQRRGYSGSNIIDDITGRTDKVLADTIKRRDAILRDLGQVQEQRQTELNERLAENQRRADEKAQREAESAAKRRESAAKSAAERARAQAYTEAEANAKVATATDDVSRAEAQLAIVRAKRLSLSPAAYQAALTQAEANVNEAKSLKELNDYLARTSELLGKSIAGADKGITAGFADQFKDVEKSLDGIEKGRAAAADAAFQTRQRQEEQGIRTLAGLYNDLFTGGVKGIWSDFQRLGEQAIAKIAAQKTFAFIANLFGQSASDSTSNFFSALGNDTGGSFTVGGQAGIDNNVLSINGVPRRRVSSSETVAVVPRAAMMMQQGATPQGGSTTVAQTIVLDARYGIMTPELLEHVNNTAAQAAVFGAQFGAQGGVAEIKRQFARPSLPQSLG